VTQRHETIAVDGVEYAWHYRHGWVAIGLVALSALLR